MNNLTPTMQLVVVIAIFIALCIIVLFIVVVYSIIKTQTNTRILTEQNEQIIAQNIAIINELKGIRNEQINTSQNQIKYMQFMTKKQQQ